MSLLQRAVLLDEDRTRLLLSWRHPGFSVHNFVTVPAGDRRAPEALARYCLRNPVSLARLRWTPGSETATYLPRDGHDDEKASDPRFTRLPLRCRPPRSSPRHPLFGADGPNSSAGSTRSIPSSVPAARP
jgi:hypothetical protein